ETARALVAVEPIRARLLMIVDPPRQIVGAAQLLVDNGAVPHLGTQTEVACRSQGSQQVL
ncbi:MAG: hypothetical protein M1488_03225, partial [Gammaproteobacteria bacterium]|nr:hypothetical protein [Gammaproteobacteria bacterium]